MAAFIRLRLTEFRNYAALDLRLDARHVCLFGPNGAGKTNLIEAITQFSPGRGLRSTAIGELVRQGQQGGWTVSAELKTNDEDAPHRIGVALETTGQSAKRVLRIDGANATATDLAEMLRIVWLTPAMDGVFRAGAGDRRKFFDRQVMAHIPSHGTISAQYDKAMRERNALLEQGRADPAWLDAIEARMAETGAQVSENRAEVLRAMRSVIETRPEGEFPKAELDLVAKDRAVTGDLDALRDALRSGRRRDAAAGRSLDGPHRADLAVIHAPTGQPAALASTGQQKALLIGLILASARALSTRGGGTRPILLLDEAAAHLDADRRAALFDELDSLGGQSWLTGTDEALFEAFGDRAQRVGIRDGAIATGA